MKQLENILAVIITICLIVMVSVTYYWIATYGLYDLALRIWVGALLTIGVSLGVYKLVRSS